MYNKRYTAGRLLFLVLLLVLVAAGCQQQPASWAANSEQDISKLWEQHDQELQLNHIRFLTTDEMAGRMTGSPEERLAGDYLAGELARYGLKPWEAAGLNTYMHSFFVDRNGMSLHGQNLIGVLAGQESDSYLIVGAHYDHLGIRDGEVYNGADDNAVSVSTVLELARSIKQSGLLPKRTLVFVLFSGEEIGLRGSAALVDLLREKQLTNDTIFLNLEMLGGVGGDWMDVYDQGMGAKTNVLADRVQQEIESTGVASKRFQRDPGSDAHPFANAEIPSLTVDWAWSPENHPHYHQPTDDFENLRPDLIEQATRALYSVTWALANR